jgi:fluoride exporter
MTRILLIGFGGFLGAIARYGLSGWVQAQWPSHVPWGTMSVNVLGCFLLGVLMAFSEERPLFSVEVQFFLRVGLLGAFTTFSTLGYETVDLFLAGHWRESLLSLAANLFLGAGSVLLGIGLVRWQFE